MLSRVPLIVEDGEGLVWTVEAVQVRGGWTWWVRDTPFGGEVYDGPDGRQAALEMARKLVHTPLRRSIRWDILWPDWLDNLTPPRTRS